MGPNIAPRAVVLAAVLSLGLAGAAAGRVDPAALAPTARPAGDKLHVTDGSYVMTVGELQVHLTNFGLIGSQYSITSTYADAPSAQWPSGSGIEYLFAAGLWIGGYSNGAYRVSTAQYQRELRPPPGPEYTIYESRYGYRVRPTAGAGREGARVFEEEGDDDGDGLFDEDPLNGFDDDGDGRIDEDFEQLGTQMMVCTMVDNSPLALEEYSDHEPLGVEVVQTAYAWEMDDTDDFLVIRYDIRNIGVAPIDGLRVGLFADPDIGDRTRSDAAFDDMAAHFAGYARASNGLYESVDVAYMYDGNQSAPVPGYFGVMFLGPNLARHRIANVQFYTGERPYVLGGDPTNDAERYDELSRTRSDPDVRPGFEADYRMLVSNGSYGRLIPGRTVTVEVVLACGNGLEGLLETCANAQQAWDGAWYDLDDDPSTGRYGRETFMCIEDFGLTLSQFALSPFSGQDRNFLGASCVPSWMIRPLIPSDLELQPDGRHCLWVNTDACYECERIRGQPCTQETFPRSWNCTNYWLSVSQRRGCTGVGGREGVVRWITDAPPPPPNLRVWPRHRSVHVYWNDDSEHTPDFVTGVADFESYRIWRADGWDRPPGTDETTGPSSRLWSLLAEYDLENTFAWGADYTGEAALDTLPLGLNTGLDPVLYRPACLDEPQFLGLAEAMAEVFAAGIHVGRELRPPLRDADGRVNPGLEPLLPWEHAPAVLDTFYWALPWEDPVDPGRDKRGMRFYEYVDDTPANGFLYFYSVTASDHALVDTGDAIVLTGPGVQGDPSTSFAAIRPGTDAATRADLAARGPNIYVYPNPATVESLDEFQALHPNADDPTGWRVMFANLPACLVRIEIYSLNADLVASFEHDGGGGFGEASWNLVSRNGQQVVSGVYLYAVRPLEPGFEDFVGKFVVIR